MQALLNAIFTKFTSTGSLTAAFPGGMFPDIAPKGTTMPYVIRKIISTPSGAVYGNTQIDRDVIIRFSAVGIGHDATLAKLETLTGVYDNTLLSLASGTMTDATRIKAPFGFQEPNLDGTGLEVWRWSVDYKYSVRN